MPHRSKQEAELRLKMAMARALMRQGKSNQEMLEAFREHDTVVSELERSQSSQIEAASGATEQASS